MVRTLSSHGINWIWYLAADFNDKDMTCHIYYHERWHKWDDSNHPKSENTTFEIVEYEILNGEYRIAKDVKVMPLIYSDKVKRYEVTNPKYVFDYKDMSVYESESS